MHLRALTSLLLSVVALVATALPATAAPKQAKHPTISKVSPMNARIGEPLAIRGRNYLPGRDRTTVVFKRDGKRAIFVKADEATKRRLVVVVPEKLKPFLKDGGTKAATFRLRILAGRFGKRFTTKGLSPLVGPRRQRVVDGVPPLPALPAPPAAAPGNCDGDGLLDPADPDDDNDQLPDEFETGTLKTGPCNADSDGDGMEDGWEYKAAFDLNADSCLNVEYPQPCVPATPAPTKRPHPNPLDGSDASIDFDGDSLPMAVEFRAWAAKPGHTIGSLRVSDGSMWYSDGLQASQDSRINETRPCRGLDVPPPLGVEAYRNGDFDLYSLDSPLRVGTRFGGDGCLNDGERDEDGDFLSNFDEVAGELTGPGYLATLTEEPAFPVPFAATDFLTADSDGDGRVDGKDDQDNDDFWNVEELVAFRGPSSASPDGDSLDRSGLWVHVYNPCLPAIYSRTCPTGIPLTGSVWRPFSRDEDPEQRWPLYRDSLYSSAGVPERWTTLRDGTLAPDQQPPPHPLPR